MNFIIFDAYNAKTWRNEKADTKFDLTDKNVSAVEKVTHYY